MTRMIELPPTPWLVIAARVERGRHAADRAAPVDADPAVGDGADVGGGAAHVDHQHVPEAVVPGQRAGALQAARAGRSCRS